MKYFFMAFGPDKAHKHPVEGGVYGHHKGYIDRSRITRGDIALLYCAGFYPGHDQEAPGVGVVTSTETGGAEERIYYQYLPLDRPVDWDTIKNSVPELKWCTNFSLRGNWLRSISRASFTNALADRQIDWPPASDKEDLDKVPRLGEETRESEGLLTLTANADPVLAEIWDNEKDAAYDRL